MSRSRRVAVVPTEPFFETNDIKGWKLYAVFQGVVEFSKGAVGFCGFQN